MISRPAARAACVCTVLALLAGCGGGGRDGGGRGAAGPESSAADAAPPKSRPPARGRGSEDPDDLNGDGHRDLVLTVPEGARSRGAGSRPAVVYGSAHGPDLATRAVFDRRDLGLPAGGGAAAGVRSPALVTTADLDGDGFADLVSHSTEKVTGTPRPGRLGDRREVAFVSWSGPKGPRPGERPVRLPVTAGLASLVRGDFDGDGHHDLAGLAGDGSSVTLLFGPFTRTGAPARTDRRPGVAAGAASHGHLVADAVAPSGRPRTTPLLVRHGDDGEQSGSLLFAARPGGGLAATGRAVRAGNAVAFGDFDGDGTRDLAVGDDGSRNNEPGHETEPADVHGSYAVVPGDGGSPRTYRLPDQDTGASSVRSFFAVDPDGDGTDRLLVARHGGEAALVDGGRRTGARLTRSGPARVGGTAVPGRDRRAQVRQVGDFDGDGADEVVLAWTPPGPVGRHGDAPLQWWVADGVTSKDLAAFATRGRE